MMSPSWNNFLRSLLLFVVVRSSHNEGLGRIFFKSIFLILRWQKEEKERHQKEEDPQFRLHECWPSFVGHLFSDHLSLPSVSLCGHPHYRTFNKLGFELCYLHRRYFFYNPECL
ncbi:hypothetical protein PVAP13_3NG181301 [Panicum virgatum]|uniref:Secreted protein n=1 Tax=Panicum virgatum TaxID=38727 RepID=A0A8T0U3F3_PANVG|nr:hypothetical protein PVAP13_3NG181301 [Panicum virgatum]KAG2617470.1 hypothetical protein PVAP13_3NG181301 [Panicum virgatum]